MSVRGEPPCACGGGAPAHDTRRLDRLLARPIASAAMKPTGRTPMALALLLLCASATSARATDAGPPAGGGPPAGAEGEQVIEPTAGQGAAHAGDEAQAQPDQPAEETTSEGLRSESLETRASGRPDHPRSLREIVASGYIRVLTRNNDTSFFIYRGHRMGFDYELGKKLAQRMGIRVDMVITNNWNDMVPALL